MLKAIRSLLKNKVWWWFLLCLVVCACIWLIGPAISIYEKTPLQSVSVRVLSILTLGLLFILIRYGIVLKVHVLEFFNLHGAAEFHLFNPWKYQERRQIRRDFKKLKAQRSYDLPWYLVMGEQGAGKTSLLREVELTLRYQSYNHIKHHTKSFQWILAEESLFIDLPAEFCWQKSEQQRFSWLMFLKYLKQARRRRPINGLILTLNLRDWLDQKRDDWLESMRERLHELQDKMGLSIPVYLVFTHIDVLPGFAEFVLHFTEEERKAVLGLTFNDAEPALEQFPLLYDALIRSLNQRLRRDLEHHSRYIFPMQMAAMREKLLALGQFLFMSRKHDWPLPWRGLYFVSNGLMGGDQFDVLLDESCLNVTEVPRSLRNRRFFSEAMFKQAILKESEWVGVQETSEWHFSLWQYAKLLLLISVTLGAVSLWAINMVQHLNQNRSIDSAASYTDLNSLAQLYHCLLYTSDAADDM
jgi:type VI secretion system protein ImpL